jgi:DNA-binding NtrC family response regulator
LVEGLLAKINRELHRGVRRVAPETMAALARYRWPGNVRELENALTRAVVLSTGEVLEARHLPLAEIAPAAPPPAAGDDEPGLGLVPLRAVERRHVERVLTATGWNKRRACAVLEISRPTLDRKIAEFGLARPGGVGDDDGGEP